MSSLTGVCTGSEGAVVGSDWPGGEAVCCSETRSQGRACVSGRQVHVCCRGTINN